MTCYTILTFTLALLLILATPRRWGGWGYRAWVAAVFMFAVWVIYVVGE